MSVATVGAVRTASPLVAVPARPGPTRPDASPAPACRYGAARKIASLQERAVQEASGLTYSLRSPTLLWTHNDSGNNPRLYALDGSGQRLATVQVEGASNVDWEDIGIGPGRNGQPALYIADTGDNNESRREVAIYRVEEPVLPREPGSGIIRTTPATKLSFAYPDGPHNVETLLVHPVSGEIVLLVKDISAKVGVYRLPTQAESGKRLLAERITTLDYSSFGPLAGAPTGGAVSPDGRRVAVRTYVALVEYDLPTGAPLASFWQQSGRVFPLHDGKQGEGISYSADGRHLLTISEGSPANLFEVDPVC
ncbi:MAG: hypothetical protein IT307_15450 [Chloroflexi bacterium]|nr:hypothetical protein [Chloroflexota bacterium]